MCRWSYAHHHHSPTCSRPIDIFLVYRYGPCAITDPVTGEMHPCENTVFDDDSAQVQVDTSNPCASGGCLPSPDCSSGGCRLAQLGGRWACCLCGGRGNEYRWCQHQMRMSPDTFCYHVCCEGCWADPWPTNSSSSASGGSGSGSGSSKRSRR